MMRTARFWICSCLFIAGCEFFSDDSNSKNDPTTTGAQTGGAGTSATTGTTSATTGSTSGGAGSQTSTGAGGNPLDNSNPTPPTAGTKFPFPQNRTLAACSYPTVQHNTDVQALYTRWKQLFVTADGANGELRVQRDMLDGHSNDTVSEGIGYGMVISVYMGDQATFDKLWLYEQKFLDGNGLMNWHINPTGQVQDANSATDGDEDMAWGLVMADQQWGGHGTLSDTYLNLAKGLIGKIWQFDVDHGRGEMLKAGDAWNEDKTNPSYFAPAYYRVFQKVTGDANWAKVIDSSYSILAKALSSGNSANGLVPDWCTSSGSAEGTYSYDACRTPFRIGLDACLFGQALGQSYVAKTSQFFAGIGANSMKDHYNLDGTPASGAGAASIPFVGPASVGAMSSASYQKFLNDSWTRIAGVGKNEVRYFNLSWGVMSTLMLSGNFLDYTAYP